MSIRFTNLPRLLNDMQVKRWVIDTFPFEYKNNRYVVVLKVYPNNGRRPSQYAQVQLEFIDLQNANNSIFAYADFFEVKFPSVQEFVDFFNITSGVANRDLFVDFSEVFKNFIPNQKIIAKNDAVIRRIQGSRCEGNDPNAVYCFDVRRNGRRDGQVNTRTIANSNKAETLRPTLFARYKDDLNLSFFFSPNPDDECSDEEIFAKVANRQEV